MDAIPDEDAALVEQVIARVPKLAGPAEPPARIHGDLWQGNLCGQPTATSGSSMRRPPTTVTVRPTSRCSQLFGAPLLADILAAYDAAFPLSTGWRDRIALHQLHPLLIHAVLFGGHYGARAGAAARAALG